MKLYELSLLVHPDLENNLDGPVKTLKGIVEEHGGKIVSEENAGKKRLTYKINGQDFAVYLFWDVELPADAVARLQNRLNITDEVLRYLLVAADEKGRAALSESKARAEKSEKSDESEE